MNKKILAAAALAIVSGSAMADGPQLYGILDISVNSFQNVGTNANQSKTSMEDGTWLPSVWGIKGSEDLGDGMTAHYNLESNLTATTGSAGSTLFLRASNVGIKGEFGDITDGERLDPIWIQSVAEQAMGVHHAGSAGIATGVFGNQNYQNPGVSPTTTFAVFGQNWLYYDAPKIIDNVSLSAGYQFGNVAGSNTAASGQYLGGAYSKGGLTVNVGAETQNNSVSAAAGYTNNKVNRYLLGVMYTFGDFTVEGQEMRVSSSGAAKGALSTGYVDAQIGQVGIAYNVSPKLKVGAQYVFVNDNYTNARPTLTSVSAVYSLSKRTALYGQVEQANAANGQGLAVGYTGQGNASSTSNSSVVTFGMYHTF